LRYAENRGGYVLAKSKLQKAKATSNKRSKWSCTLSSV